MCAERAYPCWCLGGRCLRVRAAALPPAAEPPPLLVPLLQSNASNPALRSAPIFSRLHKVQGVKVFLSVALLSLMTCSLSPCCHDGVPAAAFLPIFLNARFALPSIIQIKHGLGPKPLLVASPAGRASRGEEAILPPLGWVASAEVRNRRSWAGTTGRQPAFRLQTSTLLSMPPQAPAMGKRKRQPRHEEPADALPPLKDRCVSHIRPFSGLASGTNCNLAQGVMFKA